MGVFYPNFAFYGGTLYAIGGYVMVITGSPVATFVGMIVLAFAAAYGGTAWIARQAGLDRLTAHLPATIVVTGAYYLSDAYGRGSWPEMIAISMVPLLIASGLDVVRSGPRPKSLTILAATTIIWSGSHNITFEWGTIFIAAIALSLVIASLTNIGRTRYHRLLMTIGVIVCGVMVNGWFLLPDIANALNTQIAQYRGIDPAISGIFSRLSIVFNPLRVRATDSTYLRSHFTELPVLVIVWLLCAAAIMWKSSWPPRARRLALLLATVLVVFLTLVVDEHVWSKLPSTLTVIQFTFRLQPEVVMAIAALVIVLLRIVEAQPAGRLRTGLFGSLVAIVLFGLGLATWQVWNSDASYYSYSRQYLAHRSSVLRYPHNTPPTWYEIGQFRDVTDQIVPTDGTVRLDPAEIHGESTTQLVRIPNGEGPLASNIAASATMVTVSGLQIAGRTADGFLALARPATPSAVVRVSVRRADTNPMVLGPYVTLLGILGLVAAIVLSTASAQQRWRRRPSNTV